MDVLLEIVRSLLVIIILAGFLEMLLPEGGFRPWVRFAAGLFVLVAILSPLLGLLRGEHRFSLEAWDHRVEAAEQQRIAEQGAALQAQLGGASRAELEQKLKRQLEAVALLAPEVNAAESAPVFDANGALVGAELWISAGPPEEEMLSIFSEDPERAEREADITARLQVFLESFYGLKPEQVEINFVRGGLNGGGMAQER